MTNAIDPTPPGATIAVEPLPYHSLAHAGSWPQLIRWLVLAGIALTVADMVFTGLRWWYYTSFDAFSEYEAMGGIGRYIAPIFRVYWLVALALGALIINTCLRCLSFQHGADRLLRRLLQIELVLLAILGLVGVITVRQTWSMSAQFGGGYTMYILTSEVVQYLYAALYPVAALLLLSRPEAKELFVRSST